MKIIFITTALLFSVINMPILAQAPAAKKQTETKTKITANDVALEALNHVKSIFTITATATDIEKAAKAAAEVQSISEKIVALQAVLKATPMPTVAEKKAFAQKMLQYGPQVSVIIKKMTSTLDANSDEVNKMIQPAVTSFQAKIKLTMTLIDTYYPEKEMTRYMNELKGK
jgi:hypothetical protein